VIEIHPLEGIPEIAEDDDLAEHVARAAELRDGDVVVLAQKAVSKAEGRIVRLADVEPSAFARTLAADNGDARQLEVILREARRVLRARQSFVIAETRHGFICASAGVDASNAPEAGTVVLLPDDPDASAVRIRERLHELTGATVGVIVSDSFGRPWRQGTIDVAIGVAGIPALLDLRGTRDASGYELRSTQIAVADELASAAELVMGKDRAVPGAVIRGLRLEGEGTAQDIPIPEDRDLFR
jgi:coenzyme F420-0:L-glutamate ligase / coenzyme F420-1:gamma-L-glutamate ligase